MPSIARLAGHVRPRRFRLYGVGDGKTGTVTLARKFRRYRSAHEVDAARMVPLSTQLLDGALVAGRARKEIRRRSRRFNLEVDSANFLSPLAGEIAGVYDDAKFVLLIRDCFSWLDARVEWLVTRRYPTIWSENFAARYGRHPDVPVPEEAPLIAAGLLPIASYLRYWAELPDRVLRDVPEHRLRVIRTEDLDDANELLAEFVGVAPSTIETVHANRNLSRTGLLSTVPVQLIVDRATELCAPLMQRFWGSDWLTLTDRLPHQ